MALAAVRRSAETVKSPPGHPLARFPAVLRRMQLLLALAVQVDAAGMPKHRHRRPVLAVVAGAVMAEVAPAVMVRQK